MERYGTEHAAFAPFAVTAHQNAGTSAEAVFHNKVRAGPAARREALNEKKKSAVALAVKQLLGFSPCSVAAATPDG